MNVKGRVYEVLKCSICGEKVLFSHERQDFCPSCSSEIIIDTTSGRKETKLLSLRVLGILSIIGGIFGGIISTIWGIANNKIVELIWIIPLGITIGFVIPFIAYIAVALLLARIFY